MKNLEIKEEGLYMHHLIKQPHYFLGYLFSSGLKPHRLTSWLMIYPKKWKRVPYRKGKKNPSKPAEFFMSFFYLFPIQQDFEKQQEGKKAIIFLENWELY